MQSRDKIAYLGALSLLMSLAELFVPRPLPFFRLGLANIPLLLGLSLDIRSYTILLAVKAIGNSYISGTLFSLFALMSLAQTFASGLIMYASANLCRNISSYSVSLLGALASTVVQIAAASLYAGRGALMFLPLMLLIAFPSSILVAYAARRIKLPEAIPDDTEKGESERKTVLPVISMAVTVGSVLMMDDIPLLAAALLAALCFQKRCRRKIMIMPHIMTLIFMIISSLLTPEGRILLTLFSFPITENALLYGIAKALSLSATMALSQGFSTQLSISSGIIGRTLYLFSLIESTFRSTSGSLKERMMDALELKMHDKSTKTHINVSVFTLIALSFVFLFLFSLDILIF